MTAWSRNFYGKGVTFSASKYGEISIKIIKERLIFSGSSRISKGQGYQGFLRKRAGRSFDQKRAIRVVQGKT
jgi:hypothetical protein